MKDFELDSMLSYVSVSKKTKKRKESKRQAKRRKDMYFLDRSFLGEFVGQRLTFTAEFERFGAKTISAGTADRTFVVRHVSADGEEVCQHVWLHFGQCRNIAQFEKKMHAGSKVTFSGEVYQYVHDFVNRSTGNSQFGRAKYSIRDVEILKVA